MHSAAIIHFSLFSFFFFFLIATEVSKRNMTVRRRGFTGQPCSFSTSSICFAGSPFAQLEKLEISWPDSKVQFPDATKIFVKSLQRATSTLCNSQPLLMTLWWVGATSRISAKCKADLAALMKCLSLELCHLLPLTHALHTTGLIIPGS